MKLSDTRLAELEADAENGEYIDWNDWNDVGYLIEEVRSSRAAIARIERAWNDPGAVPSYHERMKRIMQHQWPALVHAIRRAIT